MCRRRAGKIIVSIVAGVEVSTYMKELELEGKNVPVIRILPNTACLIGKGFILIEQGDSYTKEQEDEFRYILREAGEFDSLPASPVCGRHSSNIYIPGVYRNVC